MKGFLKAKKPSEEAPPLTKQQVQREAVGKLVARDVRIPREADGLFNLLTGYLDGSASQSTKQKGVAAGQQKMLSTMNDIIRSVIGREQDSAHGQSEIKPSYVTTLKQNMSEVNKFVGMKDLVQLYHEHGRTRMKQLSQNLRGATPALKLKQLPEQGNGGIVGTLVTWHAESAPQAAASNARPASLALWP